jgi:PHB de-polymerase C-terminus
MVKNPSSLQPTRRPTNQINLRLSRVAHSVPTSVFQQLVELGDGRVRAAHLPAVLETSIARTRSNSRVISRELRGVVISSGTCLFREWYARPIDLPGTYYLQVVQWLYKDNQLATGRFAAFGRPIDLSIVRGPIFLLAARDDEIVAPEQLLAARHLVGSKERQIRTEVVA